MNLTPNAIRWAIHPAEAERIEQLPGISNHTATELPKEGETLIHPYLIDPVTRQPCPVVVYQVIPGYPEPRDVTVVVSRPQ